MCFGSANIAKKHIQIKSGRFFLMFLRLLKPKTIKMKGFHTSNDVSILFFAKSIIVFGVFHFTDGYDTISTIYRIVPCSWYS